MAETKSRLLTPKARLLWAADLFTAKANDSGKLMFSCTLVFDREAQATPEFKALLQAYKDVRDETLAKAKGADPADYRNPFQKADKKAAKYSGYEEGSVYLNVKTKFKPQVIGRRKEDLTEEDCYSGCYVRATLERPYYYENKGNKGFSFGLGNVQKIADGDRLGGGASAEDEFDAVDSGGTTGDDLDDLLA